MSILNRFKECVRASLLCSVTFIVLPGFLVLAPPVRGERLPIKTYTVADGLLRDSVAKIKQDSRGFLWFCTAGGISRFDGYAFTNFTTDDGLPERYVNDFLETGNGEIWLATDAGIAKLNPKGVRKPFQENSPNPGDALFTVYLPENPKARRVFVLFEGENGRIIAGTSDGLYQINEENKLQLVHLGKPLNDALEITSIIKDQGGALWLGTYMNGLIRLLPDGQVERFTMENGLPGMNVETLLEDKNGRIWVGMRAGIGAGLCLLKATVAENQQIVERVFTTKDGLPADWIFDLHQTSDAQFWVATTRGLCKWQGDAGETVCKSYTAMNNLCDSDIRTLTEDKDGNLWTGSKCGAKKLARYGFTTYGEADGIESSFINSIFENSAGELFVSSDTGDTRNISRFNGDKFDFVKPNFSVKGEYFGSGHRQTVWQDWTEGDWWFPSGNGIYRFEKPVRFEDLAENKPQRISPVAGRIEISRLFEDSRGDVWVATADTAGHGLWRWERKSDVWHDYTKELNFSKNRSGMAFVEDRSGNLWIATGEDDTALIRYRDGRFRIFSPQTDNLPSSPMTDLYVDRTGRLWIASVSAGLLRVDDVNAETLTFARYSTAEGLSTVGATCITEDEFGRIYACTGRGLDRLNPTTDQIENFTTADGLPTSYPIMSYRDRKNDLWFATTEGLARFTPEPERVRRPPTIVITGLRVTGVAQPISVLGETEIPALDFDSEQRQVSVDFVGLGASLGEKLKYEYRFGSDEWSQTIERTVNFANLSAGGYRLEVRTQTADKIYSQNPAIITFRIAAPFWQRWWFLLLVSLLIATLVVWFYRFRVSRLLELERVRTRIATDLHDDIGANLTRISLLSEVAKQKSENGNDNLLTSIADIARESVASMNDIVWAISPDHDSLLDLTRRMRRHAEEVFALRDIDLKFAAPEADLKLSVGVRRDVLLIFKEAVSNAAKHADCTQVSIDFTCKHSILSVRIEDNGKGFKKNQTETDGQGLRNMTRRAASLGGKLNIETQTGKGTIVELKLSLPKVGSELRI